MTRCDTPVRPARPEPAMMRAMTHDGDSAYGVGGGLLRPVRVAAVDDHPVMLSGLQVLLDAAGAPWRYERSVATVDQLLSGRACDVVLLDILLNDGSVPADNVRRIIAWGARVLLYTQGGNPQKERGGIDAGASGILSKADQAAEVLTALQVVAAGESYLSPRFMQTLEQTTPAAPLSPREREVLRLYASGMPAKTVARRLGVTEGTVKDYLKRIKAKYVTQGRAAGTKVDLLRRATEDGLIEPPT